MIRRRALARLSPRPPLIVAACGDDDDDDGPPAPPRRPSDRRAASTERTEADRPPRTAPRPPRTTGGRAPTAPSDDTTATAGHGGERRRAGRSTPTTASIPTGPTRRSRARSRSARHAVVGRPGGGRLRPGDSRASRRTSTTPTRTGWCPATSSTVRFGDDQYNPALTPGAINGALDDGRRPVHRHHRHAEQPRRARHAQRGVRAAARAASGDPEWGEVADYPWTTGANLPYDVESQAYVKAIAEEYPDGATAALFYVNSDFGRSPRTRSRRSPASSASRSSTSRRSSRPRPPRRRAGEQHRQRRARRDHGRPARRPVPGVPQRAGQRQGGQRRLGAADVPHQHVRQPADPRRRRRGGERHLHVGVRAASSTSATRRTAATPAWPSTRVHESCRLVRHRADGAAGWNIGEVTVEILRQAAESAEG